MRGEHQLGTRMAKEVGGSSPHARGALDGGTETYEQAGIIPACAGSTPAATSMDPAGRDHPRMRGEHCKASRQFDQCVGSSPHARGAHVVHHVPPNLAGIIPACAGSTMRRT